MAEVAEPEARRGEIEEPIDGFAIFSEKDRARAGITVSIGSDGEFRLHRALIARAVLSSATAPNGADGADEVDDPFASDASDDDGEGDISRSSAGAEQALHKECGFSQLLVDHLKAHRLLIRQAHPAGISGSHSI